MWCLSKTRTSLTCSTTDLCVNYGHMLRECQASLTDGERREKEGIFTIILSSHFWRYLNAYQYTITHRHCFMEDDPKNTSNFAKISDFNSSSILGELGGTSAVLGNSNCQKTGGGVSVLRKRNCGIGVLLKVDYRLTGSSWSGVSILLKGMSKSRSPEGDWLM